MAPQRQFYVYMLASKTGGTIYIGVTNDWFAAASSIVPSS
jgi:predicted GIY-YIG superfamily endonuclease